MPFLLPAFRTTVRRKEITMITALAFAAAYGAWRVARAMYLAWRMLPKRNQDLVLF